MPPWTEALVARLRAQFPHLHARTIRAVIDDCTEQTALRARNPHLHRELTEQYAARRLADLPDDPPAE